MSMSIFGQSANLRSEGSNFFKRGLKDKLDKSKSKQNKKQFAILHQYKPVTELTYQEKKIDVPERSYALRDYEIETNLAKHQ
jgi:hypothetical protein